MAWGDHCFNNTRIPRVHISFIYGVNLKRTNLERTVSNVPALRQ